MSEAEAPAPEADDAIEDRANVVSDSRPGEAAAESELASDTAEPAESTAEPVTAPAPADSSPTDGSAESAAPDAMATTETEGSAPSSAPVAEPPCAVRAEPTEHSSESSGPAVAPEAGTMADAKAAAEPPLVLSAKEANDVALQQQMLTPGARSAETEHHRTPGTKPIEVQGALYGNSPEALSDKAGEAPLIDMRENELISLLSDEGAAGLKRLTPRTLEACAEEGIEPQELVPRKLTDFAPADKAIKLAPHHQQARFNRFEERRIAKLTDVISARRRLIGEGAPSDEPLTAEEAANQSALLEEKRRRAQKAEELYKRQMRITEERRQQTARTAEEAFRRDAESQQRRAVLEAEQAAARKAKLDADRMKAEDRKQRVQAKKDATAAEQREREAAHAAHEVRRTARLAASRSAEALEMKSKMEAKARVAGAAWQFKESSLAARTELLLEQMEARQKKAESYRELRDEVAQAAVKASIAKQHRVDAAVCEVDRKQEEWAEETKKRIERRGSGNAVKAELMAQKQKASAEHAKMVVAAKEATHIARDKAAKKLIEQGELKELRREAFLAAKVTKKSDEAEARRLRDEEFEERMLRVERQREYQEQKKRDSLKSKDDKFWVQKQMLQKLSDDRKALKYKMEAEQLATSGPRSTMRELELQAEPGPTQYDNRFYSMGNLGPGGKFARVGTKKAPPAYTMGKTSETALPRVLDKSLMIELVGQISPGPGTAKAELGSREVLNKSSKYPGAPNWSMGKLVPDLADKEANSKPGPADTVASDKQMELTRYKSAPCFSFASSTYQEAYRQQKANEGKPDSAPAIRLSYTHPSRFPGVYTYNPGTVQTSLKNHRNLADGVGVSQRFNKTDRFIPVSNKNEFEPCTFTKSEKAPGPQKYRPSTSYLSTPLKF